MEIKLKLKIREDLPEIELTPKEMKELYDLLHKLQVQQIYTQPITVIEKYIETYPWWNNKPYVVTCDNVSNIVYSVGGSK
jgi:hypothetical protein